MLAYNATNAQEIKIIKSMGILLVTSSEIKLGTAVAYTPTASATGTYSGATYVKDTDTESSTYNTYIEITTNYTPGNMTWVYLGQDENGNILLTSRETTAFTMTIGGQDGWVTGPDRMDTLCNTLYGNSTYAKETRNMKSEDVDRVLGADGPEAQYSDRFNKSVTTDTPMTFGEIEIKEGQKITFRATPRLSDKPFEDYVSVYYTYTGTTYKAESTDEYNLIFNKPTYWLSSTGNFLAGNYALFNVRRVVQKQSGSYQLFNSKGEETGYSLALRPVIVLKSNIYFGNKNANGEFTLIEI